MCAGPVVVGCFARDLEDVSDGPKAPGVTEITNPTEQSETAIVASSTLLFFPTLVVGYNDGSVGTVQTCTDLVCGPFPEFVYWPSIDDPQSRTTARGASLMGWATSSTLGQGWVYRGKVRPPSGWSAIWGDPELATHPTQPNIVYYSQMGVSDAAWNGSTGGLNFTDLSPGDMVDSFCVARSNNGGISFANVVCKKATGTKELDRTAVAVDGTGRVWVSHMNTTGGYFQEIWRSTTSDWSNFSKVVPQPPITGVLEPTLVTDPGGSIWVGGMNSAGQIGVQRWNDTTQTWDNDYLINSVCGFTGFEGDVTIGSGQLIRVGRSFDFDVGYNEAGEFALRAVFQTLRPDERVALHAIELTSEHGC